MPIYIGQDGPPASGGGGGAVSSTDITDSTATGRAVLTGTQSGGRSALGLGTAAVAATGDFATAAQGTLADNAQPKIGVPSTFTSRSLTNSDDGDVLVCGSSQTATVNTGLASGFGCAFKGTIAFNGTATVTDVRTSGASNPWCALISTGTDTYDVVGSKA